MEKKTHLNGHTVVTGEHNSYTFINEEINHLQEKWFTASSDARRTETL